jgi:hypothetical protein
MVKWLQIDDTRKRLIIQQVAARTSLPVIAIEKDWWVTIVLNAIFNTPYRDSIMFKGGTSLSKGWNLIERFSEDVDIGINKDIVGIEYKGELSKTKIKKLRAASARFICNELKDAIEKELIALGVDSDLYTLSAPVLEGSYSDPAQLTLTYRSVLQSQQDGYLLPRVLIEASSRSGQEPSAEREIRSIITEQFPDADFSDAPFIIPIIEPKRTFLEKAFLLHEEFFKPPENIKYQRMSRHLYDLERLMDTIHGQQALADTGLYSAIIRHREKYTAIQGFNYTTLAPASVTFIPPATIIRNFESDYRVMTEQMIYGETKTFSKLIERISELQQRFREIKMNR